MIAKKRSKIDLKKAIFGCFFAVMGILVGIITPLVGSTGVSAIPETTNESEEATTEEPGNTGDGESAEQDGTDGGTALKNVTGDGCQNSLGAVGWLVCPTTGKIAEAVDWLYDKLEDVLVIDPVSMEEGSPINQIWQYFLGVTNIVFIIFLLVVIYSQITGIGISNYGVKKALPKLIVTAVLVNLSFLICTLAVDVSNIVGNGLRNVFTSVEESVIANMSNNGSNSMVDPETGDLTKEAKLAYADMYSSIAGGAGLAVAGGIVAFETGAIWMLIPVVLGALVAVVSGLITIALRQAVVTLLIMISPIAIVAYILPNTEQWFKKWRQLLIKMLVFYPMFSLLFGASSLAGFAIIASAKDGFGIILGTAVQIFPLFFSWSLMKMSGTFLGTINAKMQGLAAKPLAAGRAMAEANRMSAKQKHLASSRPTTPTLRLMQFMSNQNIAREAETAENSEIVKNRALAFNAAKHYDKKGRPTKDGERAYEAQARNMEYQQIIMRDKNNMNKGLGQLNAVNRYSSVAQRTRLKELDNANMLAADKLKAEQARGEKIDYENAMGFHKRMEDAVNVHFDDKYGNLTNYKKHFDGEEALEMAARARYKAMAEVMEGNAADVQYVAAAAAHGYDAQKKIIETKMQKYFELTPPTKDVQYRLEEMTKNRDAAKYIDSIIPGLRILNQRGDTDLVREQIVNVLRSQEGVVLGTHASQALASFLMFEVKDSDPWLRRFGKYINLETAAIYNKNVRKKPTVDYDEYVKGYYYVPGDPEDEAHRKYAKKGMRELMEGTSLDGIERTAMDNYVNSLMEAYSDKDGVIQDYEGFEAKRREIDKAIEPQFISAMRKALSGSEQINSMVKSQTGYEQVQKDDGTYELRSIFESEKMQKKLGPNLERYREYITERAKKYLSSLVPSQVLSMRSDELAAYEKLLPKWYREQNPDIHDELKEKFASKHNDLSEDELESIITTMESREMFRQCFDMGVLEQISRTNARRGVLDAKPKLRKLLGLDGDDGHGHSGLSKYVVDMNGAIAENGTEPEDKKVERIANELEEIYRQRQEAKTKQTGNTDISSSKIYNASDIDMFVTYIDNIRESNADVFYDKTSKYLKKQLGETSSILLKYKDARENSLVNANVDALKDYLLDLLRDPDNY